MKRVFLGVILLVAVASGGWFVTPAIAQNYDWTGIYLGGQVGAQWLNSRSSFNFPGNPGVPSSGSKTFSDTSFIGGGQVGFNWQPARMPLVLGIEGDVIGASHDKTEVIFRYANVIDHFDGRSKLDIQGSIRGRLGWAINRALLYATGGLGFGSGKVTTLATRDGVGSGEFSKSETLVGWTVGGGIEYALPFFSHWTLRAEYRYTDLGSIHVSSPGITFPATAGPWTAKGDF
jgi:outer membrane immunogenic protein